MIKDRAFKLIFIPLMGPAIPLSSHLIAFGNYNFLQILTSTLIFIITSLLVWQGSVRIISTVRNNPYFRKSVFMKLFAISTFTALFGMFVIAMSAVSWQYFFLSRISTAPVVRCCLICGAIVVLFSLVYEILFLSKEREIDSQVVRHLDQELMHAEINGLRNELDPHFVYNTLMPLYYLIKNDIQKAEVFTHKLMQVYQYSLENRQNDFVSLAEELKFSRNYFYLLQIRHRDNISLSIDIREDISQLQVLPFSLQLLIENAIKHNEFSRERPLAVTITTEPGYLVVRNNLLVKPKNASTSKIGLRNLRARYKLLCNSTISVNKNREAFLVRLPLVNNSRIYDINNYNRG
jgi:sensor histidine kinase YesM